SLAKLTAYGILTITAATAAARDQRIDTARELVNASREVADRLGTERTDHQTTFGPAKVTMLDVDCHVVSEDYAGALKVANQLPPDAPLPLAAQARHLADIAHCQTRLGRYDNALTTLLTMEKLAPDWIKYQSLPRQVTSELLSHEKRRSTRLR